MLNTLYNETFCFFLLQITMMTAMSALYWGETTSTSVSSVICARKKSHELEQKASHVFWCINLIMTTHQNSQRPFIDRGFGFDILKIQSFDFLFHVAMITIDHLDDLCVWVASFQHFKPGNVDRHCPQFPHLEQKLIMFQEIWNQTTWLGKTEEMIQIEFLMMSEPC